DHNPGAGPGPEDGAEALRLGPDAPLDDLVALGENVDLAFPLVHVDANMVHGWPLLSAALTARCSCGAAYATTSKREASRFIPSCVQRRRTRSAGVSPAGARARGPVAWMAGRRETDVLKPIDTAIFQDGRRVPGP